MRATSLNLIICNFINACILFIDMKGIGRMYKQIITKQDLITLGYSEYQSKEIIRQARLYMIKSGNGFYDNRKITVIPLNAVSKILGFEPHILEVK